MEKDSLFTASDIRQADDKHSTVSEGGEKSSENTINTTKPVLLAIDGNSLAHRAHHAYEKSNLVTRSGRPVWATYGFFALLVGICDKVKPDNIIVGFDDHTHNIRKDWEPLYKAQREAKAPELYQQMEDIKKALTELGVKVFVPASFEADDVLGSAAQLAKETGFRCVIATSDRDSFGLIDQNTTVLRLMSGLDNAVFFTPNVLEEKYGVKPESYLTYAAIRGDSSDNLLGVKGVGEKGAAKLLTIFSTMEEAISDEEKLIKEMGKSTAAKLLDPENQARFARNMRIMDIKRDLAIEITETNVKVSAESVDKVVTAYELPSLKTRLLGTLVYKDMSDNSADDYNDIPVGEESDLAYYVENTRRPPKALGETSEDNSNSTTALMDPSGRFFRGSVLTPVEKVTVTHLKANLPKKWPLLF